MSQQVPDLSHEWANATVVTPDHVPSNSKIDQGWIKERPPFEYQNWWQNRTDQALNAILQNGNLINNMIVDSINDLVGLESEQTSYVIVHSFYGGWRNTPSGPKGSSQWYYDGTTGGIPTENNTVDIITAMSTGKIISADGKGWKILTTHMLTTYMFGAKGDDISEDTLSTQSCIDFCSSIGAISFIEEGDYLIGTVTYIQIKSNTTIFGVGSKSRFRLANSSPITGSTGMFYATGVANVSIRDILIDGNRANNINLINNLHLSGDNIIVNNIDTNNSRNNGVYLNSCTNSHIINCRSVDCMGTNYRLGSSLVPNKNIRCSIINNRAYDTSTYTQHDDGFIAVRWGGSNISIIGNVCSTVPTANMAFGIWLTHGNGITVSGNVIDGPPTGCFVGVSHGEVTPVSMSDITISGNVFRNVSNGLVLEDKVAGSSISGVSVSDNTMTCSGNGSCMTAVPVLGSTFTNITVIGNTGTHTAVSSPNRFIDITSNSVVVASNSFKRVSGGGSGINLNGDHQVVVGNMLDLSSVSAAKGINFTGSYCCVNSNVVRNAPGFAIHENGGDFNSVSGNVKQNSGAFTVSGLNSKIEGSNVG